MKLMKVLSKRQGLDINYKIPPLAYLEMTSWEEPMLSMDSIQRFRSKLNLKQLKNLYSEI